MSMGETWKEHLTGIMKQQLALAKTFALFWVNFQSQIISCGTFCSLCADSSREPNSTACAYVYGPDWCAQEARSSSDVSFLSTLSRLTKRACVAMFYSSQYELVSS